MNQTVVVGILAVVAAVLILGPILRGRTPAPVAPKSPPIPAQRAPEELEELELDHAMGRVSEADYSRWKEQLAADAPAPDDSVIPTSFDARARAESLVRQWSEKPRRRCEKCGERPEPEARFCSNCGAALH